jgi:hypothetical protein
VCEDARIAGAGARDHEQRAFGAEEGLALSGFRFERYCSGDATATDLG